MNAKNKRTQNIITYLPRVFASIITALLIFGGIGLFLDFLPLKIAKPAIFFESENWLILFAQLNLGIINTDNLSISHWIDYALLFLIGCTFIVQFIILKKKNILKILFGCLAMISPFLGIYMLATTHVLGRTGLLTATAIMSVLLLIGHQFKKIIGIIGLIASIGLLLICDYLTLQKTEIYYAYFIFFFYLLWITWFVMLAIHTGEKT